MYLLTYGLTVGGVELDSRVDDGPATEDLGKVTISDKEYKLVKADIKNLVKDKMTTKIVLDKPVDTDDKAAVEEAIKKLFKDKPGE